MTASRDREFAKRAEDIVLARRLARESPTKDVAALFKEYGSLLRCTRPHARKRRTRKGLGTGVRGNAVTAAEVERMRALREEKRSYHEIAALVGRTDQTVFNHIRDGRHFGGPPRKDASEIIAALREGLTLEEIGARFGKTRERIRQLRNRHEAETGEQLPRTREIRRAAKEARIAERNRIKRPTVMQRVAEEVQFEDGHWLWTGATVGPELPVLGVRTEGGGSTLLSIRRFLRDRCMPDAEPLRSLTPQCGIRRCVNPEHMGRSRKVWKEQAA